MEKNFVKFDMHCHTHEGSPDSHVEIRQYIKILKEKGFKGMLVTDHDSYEGYENLTDEEREELGDFRLIRGIEYDTNDFGHMVIVMPKGKIPELLKYRGMSLKTTMLVVHNNGGIIGPAHPCGEPFLSFFTTGFSLHKNIKKQYFLERFDFIEGYNSCEPEENNLAARKLAYIYKKPMTAGSDAHMEDCVGLAYTMLPQDIRDEDDLIKFIKSKPNINIGGGRYGKTTKDKLGFLNHFLVYGFYYYNKFMTFINIFKRKYGLRNYKE